MKIAGYRCDKCNKDELIDRHMSFEPWTMTLPFQWYIVHVGKERGENPWTFCSMKCMKSFNFDFEESKEDVR